MPHHETDIELRAIIISLKKTGNFTISQISRITNRPPSTISTITGRYQRYGTLNNSIRPKNLNARQERYLLLLARKQLDLPTTSIEAVLKTWSSYSPSPVGSRAERLGNRRMEAFLLYRRINIRSRQTKPISKSSPISWRAVQR